MWSPFQRAFQSADDAGPSTTGACKVSTVSIVLFYVGTVFLSEIIAYNGLLKETNGFHFELAQNNPLPTPGFKIPGEGFSYIKGS